MGDNHVCSFCNEKLQGKQHIKIVFENWPIEEEVIYRRKGKEARKTRKVTKEVITAIGIECLNNPDRWKDYDIDPNKVADFFEDLRFAGKNPVLNAVLTKDGPVCLTEGCRHCTGPDCQHLLRDSSRYSGLDMLTCEIGHPGHFLVRRGKERIGELNPIASVGAALGQRRGWRQTLMYLITMSWQPQHSLATRVYFTLLYSIPILAMLAVYTLVVWPFWWMLCLKERLTWLKGATVRS